MTKPDNSTFNPAPSTEQIEDANYVALRLKALADQVEYNESISTERKTGNLMPAIREPIYNRQVVDALIAAAFAIADKESQTK